MSLFTDQYLIEYLIQNGYSKEELDNDTFDISSLSREFVAPLDLDKVTNINEIKYFFSIPISIEVSKEAINLGKVLEVSKYLADYTLVAKEQGLNLDKLYIQAIDLENEAKIPPRITLEGFDLSKINYIYGNIDKMQEILLKNCKSIDLSNLESENLFLVNCSDIKTTIERSYNNFALDGYEGNLDFLNQVTSDVMQIINLEELDLASLRRNKSYYMRIEDISKCYLSENVELNVAPHFINVDFDNRFNKQAIIKKNCTIQNCSMSSNGKMLSVDKDIILTNENIDILNSIETEQTVFLEDMEVDRSVEELKKLNKEKVILRRCTPKDGYDMRRLERILDLDLDENKDILDNPELLLQIVSGNEILETIGVAPNLSEEHKAILEKEAPKKNYSYGEAVYDEESVKGYVGEVYDTFEKRFVSFAEYREADEIYNKIIAGINPEWKDIYKFKYLYNQLGKSVSYDLTADSNVNDKDEEYYKTRFDACNVFLTILNKKSQCLGISRGYQYLCKKVGLQCDVQLDFSNAHAYNIITYNRQPGDIEVKNYCDLTYDLCWLKLNAPCKNFAIDSGSFSETHDGVIFEPLKNELLSEALGNQVSIDRELGECGENYNYKIDEYAKMARMMSDIANTEDRVISVLQGMMGLGELRHMSNKEVIDSAGLIIRMADVQELGHTYIFARNNKENPKDTKSILWVKDEERSTEDKAKYLYYVFNDEQQIFKSLDECIIEELLDSRMIEFYNDEKLPGFENWSNEKQEQKRNTGFNR